jgi:hypothetical protein
MDISNVLMTLATIVTGDGTYRTKEMFIEEAKKIGVNRAAPTAVVKKLKWGDPILLCAFTKVTRRKVEKDPKTGYYIPIDVPVGILEVFGKFNVETVTPRNLPKEAMEELLKSLDVVDTKRVGQAVSRHCGSYMVSSVSVVKNDLKDIVQKAEEIAKKYGVKNLSWFIGGPLTLRDNPIKFENVKFWRGFKNLEIKATSNPVKNPSVVEMADYKRSVICPVCGKSVWRTRLNVVDPSGKPIHKKCLVSLKKVKKKKGGKA